MARGRTFFLFSRHFSPRDSFPTRHQIYQIGSDAAELRHVPLSHLTLAPLAAIRPFRRAITFFRELFSFSFPCISVIRSIIFHLVVFYLHPAPSAACTQQAASQCVTPRFFVPFECNPFISYFNATCVFVRCFFCSLCRLVADSGRARANRAIDFTLALALLSLPPLADVESNTSIFRPREPQTSR